MDKILNSISITMLSLILFLLLSVSCTDERDLFYEYVIDQQEDIDSNDGQDGSDGQDGDSDGNSDDGSNNGDGDSNTGGDDGTGDNGGNGDDTINSDINKLPDGLPDWMPLNPTATKPDGGTVYYPKSSSEISDSSNEGKTAIIENSFDCSGCTFARNQLIVPKGGVISGRNINLNGSFIDEVADQAFDPTVTFSAVYMDSWVFPELFGAKSNDSTSDDAAIDAMIANSQFGTGVSNAVYIKNQESVYSRNGSFVWNMNDCIVRTNSGNALSHGSSTSNDSKFLMFFDGLEPAIINGEFDGNDIASRLFRVDRTTLFIFHELNIHDYFAPANAYARGVAFKLDIRADSNTNFVNGLISDTNIENIGAFSDGNANNAPFGISKGIWASLSGGNEANIYFRNNTIKNVYGDDAEGFYSDKLWGGSYNYQESRTNLIFDNESYIGCQRRAMKITTSNVYVTNSYFESAANAPIFPGAQATLVHVFSTSGYNQPLDDVVFTNNEIRIAGNAQNNPLGFTDISRCTFENNKISCDTFTAYSYIGFGTGISNPYSGDISSSVSLSNNEITNTFIHIDSVYDPIDGGAVVDGNNFDITYSQNTGAYIGVVRLFKFSGTSPTFRISNTTVNVNMQTASSIFGGVFNTWGAEPKNWVFDNVDINWTGATPLYAFAYAGRNGTSVSFDSSNTITDCDITGASGAGAVFVTGSDKSVVITNSFGEGNTPLTTN